MEAIELAKGLPTQLRLLVVDDDEDDARLIVETLRGAGFAVSARRVADPQAFGHALCGSWDLITCDHSMPGFDAVNAYQLWSVSRPDVPFVVVSGTIPPARAFEIINQGGCDYVDKASLERLVPIAVRELRNRRRLESVSSLDPVTGLANRAEMCRRLKVQSAAGRHILLVGLDRFKKINDAFGHAAGDQVLREVGSRLVQRFGRETVGRISDDEFLVVTAPDAEAGALAAEVQQTLATPFRIKQRTIYLTAGIGSTPLDPSAEACDLFSRAENALLCAKRAGPNRHRIGGPHSAADNSAELLDLEHDLRLALRRDELLLHYQPQLSANDLTTLGHEALLRWRHPRYGMVSPARFIPLAEESGTIMPIGNWVLETACRAAADGFLEKVAVNISACQFHEADLVEQVQRVLEATGLAPSRLELELTESTLITDTEVAIAQLRAIKGLGVHVAIDDFGTGYSSLSYLKRFPLDTLKIDRSFVADLESDPRSHAITESLIELGHRLGLTVLAEGVETREQARRLRELGCDRLQGFLLGKPQPLPTAPPPRPCH